MLNRFEIRGEIAVLFIKKRSGLILECVVDADDIERLHKFDRPWCAFWSETSRTYYVYCRSLLPPREVILLHRWLLGTAPSLHVDHQDHNGLNNRKSNIRSVSRSVNQLNNRKPRNNTSGYRGVVWDKNRSLWMARVKVMGKNRMIGRFSTAELANTAIVSYRKSVLDCLS